MDCFYVEKGFRAVRNFNENYNLANGKTLPKPLLVKNDFAIEGRMTSVRLKKENGVKERRKYIRSKSRFSMNGIV